MKIFNIVHGDSSAGNLKYSLKTLNKKQKIINFNDDLSVGPIYNYHTSKGKEERNLWITEELYKYGRDEYLDDFKIYLNDSEKSFLNEIVKINAEDKIIFWIGENTQDKLFLGYVLNLLEDHKNLYIVNVSEEPLYYRCLAEIEPKNVIEIIGKEKKIKKSYKEKHINNFTELTNQKGILRQIVGENIENIDDNFYDQFIFDSITLNFENTPRIIGECMGKNFQMVSDVFYEYRINKLIEFGIIEYKGDRKFMNDYFIRLNSELFRNYEILPKNNNDYSWQNAGEFLPEENSNVLIGLKIKDNENDIHEFTINSTFEKNFFIDSDGVKRLPLLIQKNDGVFTWKYIEDLPKDFKD